MQSQTEKLQKIHRIAIQDISYFKDTAIYGILEARKEAAKRHKQMESEVLINMIDYCNEKIKEYLSVW